MSEKRKLKPRGKPFSKGVTPNPDGRPKLTPEEKTIRQLTQIELVRNWGNIMVMSEIELRDVIAQKSDNPSMNTALNAALAATILKGIEHGHLGQINTALDRVIGPVKQKVEHSGKVELAELVLEANATEEKNKGDE